MSISELPAIGSNEHNVMQQQASACATLQTQRKDEQIFLIVYFMGQPPSKLV